jgi:phosphopantetheinyl transferase (holo-ACP synthase)
VEDGVVAEALEILEIGEVESLLGASSVFTLGERAYAFARSDPTRRLAARLAAKRAAARLLGVPLGEIEVVRGGGGPPRLRLSDRARESLRALGASRALVSLTHGETHAAASVLLLRDEE